MSAGAGDEVWRRTAERTSGELFALTHGALVAQLYRESGGDASATNAALERMGHAVGVRLVDDVLARGSGVPGASPPRARVPSDLRAAVDWLGSVALRATLNIAPPGVAEWSPDGRRCVLVFAAGGASAPAAPEGVLAEALSAVRLAVPMGASSGPAAYCPGEGLGSEWVVLPAAARASGLHYASLLCGVVRGVLEMLQLDVRAAVETDPLLSSDAGGARVPLRISVCLVRVLEDELPPAD